MDWTKIHKDEGFTLFTPLLALFSFIYGLGVRGRFALRKAGRESLPGYVVSVGNITVGGTGKTPAVCMLAQWALKEGLRPAILSRGYGGGYQSESLLVSDGKEIFAGPDEAGDEPCLMARGVPGVPVVVSKRRFLAGRLAHEIFKSDIFILDDGFQHLSLARDLDLVLLDAASPFGNGHLLPRGPLREPKGHLGRADAFILTRSGRGTPGKDTPGKDLGKELKAFLAEKYPEIPRFESDHLPRQVTFPVKGKSLPQDNLKGKRVGAFAAIANPDAFRQTLRELGAEVVFFKSFRDHHPYVREEFRALVEEKARSGAEYLLTTEKDWVRLEALRPEEPGLGYLEIVFSLLNQEARFFQMLRDGIKEKGNVNPV
jgi:tetraacyldisaccharide 4'-kinase